ncbi:MAG: flagellar M-ring protein FliF [Deltaproteobacteria bacterium]|nr:flagellar M-ring protein FliF [Deltaproteobacteria bacterium]
MPRFLQVIKEFFDGLSPARKFSFFLILALVVAGLIAIILWGNKIDYRPLYADLNPQDANAIVEALKSKKIPYRLDANGTAISVPVEQYGDARLFLAGEGMPSGGSLGYELFDKAKLGMSEFLQKVNLRRALEGELAKTISHIEEIRLARVHLVIPERALFADEQQPATASVVLTMAKNAVLTQGQIKGIVNLVSRSIEGLSPQNVSIVDNSGNTLYGGVEIDGAGMLSQTQHELKSRIESALQRKVTKILEQTIGKNKVVVQVDADVNFTETKQTKEIYDPEQSAVRSEQRQNEESMGGGMSPAGVPGVKPNVEGQVNESGAVGQNVHRKSGETINYEITKVVQDSFEPGGDIQKLSLAVLVDGAYTKETDQTGAEKPTYVPRSPEEMAKYKTIVQNAIGYDEVRGDSVEVVNLPFERVEVDKDFERMYVEAERRLFWAPYVKYGIMLALAMVVIFFVVRPVLKSILTARPEKAPPAERLLTEEDRVRLEMTKELSKAEEAEKKPAVERVRELAAEDPEHMARLMRSWMKE